MFALSKTLPWLIIARVLQGMPTAIVFTVGFALLLDKNGSRRIGQAMGWTSMSLSLGLFLGPVVGGVIYQLGGYFAVFVPALSLIAIEVILMLLIIEHPISKSQNLLRHGEEAGPPDYGTFGDESCIAHAAHPPSLSSIDEEQSHQESDTDTDARDGKDGDPMTVAKTHSVRFPVLLLLRSPRLLVAMAGLFMMNSFSSAFESVVSTTKLAKLLSIKASFPRNSNML